MVKKIPRKNQIADLAFLIKQKKGGLLHDPAVGKTLPVCLFIQWLWSSEGGRTYFMMPKSLLQKNYDEILECTNLTHSDVMIIDGTPKKRMIQMSSNAKVFLMGFTRFAADWQTLRKLHPDMKAIIIDEFHMGFKSIKSKRTTQLVKATNLMPYFIPMSGTLISGRLDSCYPAIHIIEPRYYGNHHSFLAQHAITDEYGTVVAWTNHAKLGHIFGKHFRRRTFEQEYGVTEHPLITIEMCGLNAKQSVAYNEFEEKALLELKEGFLVADSTAVASIRCRQIMAHPETFGITKDGELTGKDETLLIHLENHRNNSEPLLIYAALQPEQERIYNLCLKEGFRAGLINGNVSTKERIRIDEQFRAGDLDIVVGSPATSAVGYNWGHVDHVIFVSTDYQDDNFSQAYKRCIRGKRIKRLWVTLLLYETKVERRIVQILNGKSKDRNLVDDTYLKLEIGK